MIMVGFLFVSSVGGNCLEAILLRASLMHWSVLE